MPNTTHRFHIKLEGIDPPVWRRIRVPSGYSFWDLHVAIQDAMGWLDYHLHLFHVRNPETGEFEAIGIPDNEPYLDETPYLAGWEVPIARYFVKEGDAASYEYDFGDDWRHTVALEGVETIRKGERQLSCLGGERRCPPEDCGGIHGYAELLEVMADVTHPERPAMPQWLGGANGPQAFSASDVKFDDPKVRWRNAFSHD
jgi:hypothetical protein